MNENIKFDDATDEWFELHHDTPTTLVRCSECGLFYKASLGHNCEYKQEEKMIFDNFKVKCPMTKEEVWIEFTNTDKLVVGIKCPNYDCEHTECSLHADRKENNYE